MVWFFKHNYTHESIKRKAAAVRDDSWGFRFLLQAMIPTLPRAHFGGYLGVGSNPKVSLDPGSAWRTQVTLGVRDYGDMKGS